MDEHQLAMQEPVDSDVGPDRPTRSRTSEFTVIAAISVGGVIGALGRYEAALWWPTPTGRFPWTTFGVNVLGCALIGVLLVLVTDVVTGRPLLRPFLGTGVLGGFTTFSTYALDTQRLIAGGHPGPALGYLAGTLVAALAAVTLSTQLTRRAVAVRR